MMSDSKNDLKDASMEEILSSIRKYVSDDSDSVVYDGRDDDIFELNEDHIFDSDNQHDTVRSGESGKRDSGKSSDGSVFTKLAKAIRSQNKPRYDAGDIGSMTMAQFIHKITEDVVRDWCENNLTQIVEEMVSNEIERLKSE